MRSFFFLSGFLLFVLCLQAQPTTYPSSFTVAQDGSGQFRTIQEAVNAVRDLSQQRVTIFIRNGIYHEKLVVPSWKTMISLVGESRDSTIISYNDFSGKPNRGGRDFVGKDTFTTYTSYTVLVEGNDFSAENLTIENTAGRVGQAVALHAQGNRCLIRNCRLLGNQDTLYTATENSHQYYLNSLIEGTTDFIFGEATAVFDHCQIRSLTNSYITAASTRPGQPYGFVFLDCRLIADTAIKKVYLGRPWRPYSRVVYIRTEMGAHITAAGWDNWRNADNEKTAYYAEYESKGAGATNRTDAGAASRINSGAAKGSAAIDSAGSGTPVSPNSGRAPWSRQLTAAEAASYTPLHILGDWIDKVPVHN